MHVLMTDLLPPSRSVHVSNLNLERANPLEHIRKSSFSLNFRLQTKYQAIRYSFPTMADDAATSAEESQLTFNVKAANDQKLVVTISANATVADLKAKLASPELADVPAERQRLIYSGRVLKDPDTLATVKIKDGHTVHLVKGAASNVRQNPANQGAGSNTPTSHVPTNLATGTGNNPLAGLTGARYAGFHGLPGADMFGPDGGVSLGTRHESSLGFY